MQAKEIETGVCTDQVTNFNKVGLKHLQKTHKHKKQKCFN